MTRDNDDVEQDTRRHRIKGSIFLIAVAAIIFPMIFDGEGLPPVKIEPLPEVALPVRQEPPPELPENPYVEKVEALAATVDEEGFSTDTGTQFGEAVLSRPDADTRVFAIQVGSFSSEARALSLRDELRGAGYEAFLSSIKTDGRVMIRVAIGPFMDGAKAEKVRLELARTLTPDARVMAMST